MVFMVGAGIPTFGQALRGRIDGTVKDQQGQVVPNAELP
jgi:hypothetical protein